jgi:actin-related protein 5
MKAGYEARLRAKREKEKEREERELEVQREEEERERDLQGWSSRLRREHDVSLKSSYVLRHYWLKSSRC